jgi:hypothetical protein
MIAAGRYDWTNVNITLNFFQVEGNGAVEFEGVLFHFGGGVSSDEAKKQIEAAGYEVGKIEHILCFGANYPEEQRKFPIVGLGSVSGIGGSNRGLNRSWWGSDWPSHCRFLGIRKKVSQTLMF